MRSDYSEHGTSSPLEGMPSFLGTAAINTIIWNLSYMPSMQDNFVTPTVGWVYVTLLLPLHSSLRRLLTAHQGWLLYLLTAPWRPQAQR